jgi:hypothetical protein
MSWSGRKANLHRARTIGELREEFADIRSTTAGDVRFNAQAAMFIAEHLIKIEEALTRRGGAKRQPSEWQKFFAKGLKAGKSAREVAAEWQARKVINL